MAKDFTSGLTGTPYATALQAMYNSAANTAGDKKALVIFYLDGGLDCHNYIPPANTASDNSIKYRAARPAMYVPVDTSKQTLLPGSTEWQMNPRFFGKQHVSTAQPDIVTSDSEIAVTGNYNRDDLGVVTVDSTSHGLVEGDKIYADFSPFANTTPASAIAPTDGLYSITYIDTSKFTITPQPVVSGTPIALTAFKFVKEKNTAMAPFRSGDAAVIMNVGPLVYPAYRNEFNPRYPYNYFPESTLTKKLPLQLSSHSDQKLHWYTATPQLPSNKTGWLGRTMDLINPAFNVDTDIPTTFLLFKLNSGTYSTVPNLVSMNPTGLVAKSAASGSISTARFDQYFINNTQVTNPMMREYLDGQIRANTNLKSIGTMLTSGTNATFTNFSTTGDDTTFGPVTRIKSIVQLIRSMHNNTTTVSGPVSQRRQIHHIVLGGFDQHDGLIEDLDKKMIPVAKTINQFWKALNDVNTPPAAANNTLMMIYSEFGRSLYGNEDGSDHAWGGHVTLVGKPVNGFGKSKSANGVTYVGSSIYGSPPNLNVSGPDFVPFASLLIPTTPVDTVYATIAKWFGVPDDWYDADGNVVPKGTAGAVNPMELVLPNLSNFDYNPSANIFAPTWAQTGETFREMKSLLKDYTFDQ